MTEYTKESIVDEIINFESRFRVRNHDGICIDWIAASKDKEGWLRYIRNRDWMRASGVKV